MLIDLSPPMSVESCLNIQQALTNTLTLLHHMSTGPSRVPFIGLFVLGNYPEVSAQWVAQIPTYSYSRNVLDRLIHY